MTTTRPADLNHVYSDMYSPTMDSAHGPAAIKMPAATMIDRAASGEAELVYIYNGDEPVGGSLIVYDSGSPRLLSMGILHGDRVHLRAGVGDAIYLFSFRHLLSRGFGRVDIGRTRPFLNDGTLYYKRRLGMRLSSASKNGFFLKFLKQNRAVEDFICANPFVYSDRSALKGVACFREESERDAAAGQQVPGLADFALIDIREGIPQSPGQL